MSDDKNTSKVKEIPKASEEPKKEDGQKSAKASIDAEAAAQAAQKAEEDIVEKQLEKTPDSENSVIETRDRHNSTTINDMKEAGVVSKMVGGNVFMTEAEKKKDLRRKQRAELAAKKGSGVMNKETEANIGFAIYHNLEKELCELTDDGDGGEDILVPTRSWQKRGNENEVEEDFENEIDYDTDDSMPELETDDSMTELETDDSMPELEVGSYPFQSIGSNVTNLPNVPTNIIPSPILLDDKTWKFNENRHPVKIVYEIKRDLILQDFIEKLEKFSK